MSCIECKVKCDLDEADLQKIKKVYSKGGLLFCSSDCASEFLNKKSVSTDMIILTGNVIAMINVKSRL